MHNERESPNQNGTKRLNTKIIETGINGEILMPELSDTNYRKHPIYVIAEAPQQRSILRDIVVGVSIAVIATGITITAQNILQAKPVNADCPAVNIIEIQSQ